MHCQGSKHIEDTIGGTGLLRQRHLLQAELNSSPDSSPLHPSAHSATITSSGLQALRDNRGIRACQDSSGLVLTCLKVGFSLVSCNSS